MSEEAQQAIQQVEVVEVVNTDIRDNYIPGLILGLQAMVGTAWWFIVMIIYIKNNSSDANITNIAGTDTQILPITYIWERIGELDGKKVYLSVSIMFSFITYLLFSVVELIAWIFYLAGEYDFPKFYFSLIGYWGTLTTYWIAPFFAIIHLAETLVGDPANFPGSWTLFLMITGLSLWIIHGLLHIFFVDAFVTYIEAQPDKPCVCDLPEVGKVQGDDDDSKVAQEDLEKYRQTLCLIQCPMILKDCIISQSGLTNEEYLAACSELRILREEMDEEDEGRLAVDEDDEDQDDDSDVETTGSGEEKPEGEDGW